MQKIFFATRFSFFVSRMAGYHLLDSNVIGGDFLLTRFRNRSSLFFMQRRFMDRVAKGVSLLNSSFSSSSKLVCRPVSQFLLTKSPINFLDKYVLTSKSSGKLVFETYSILSGSDVEVQQAFDAFNTQSIFRESNLNDKSVLLKPYLQANFLKSKEKIIDYLKSLDFPFKEESLTAFSIGDLAHKGSSSASIMVDVKHFFRLLDLNLNFGSDNVKFIMSLARVAEKFTPDYNMLDFFKDSIVVVDGKEPQYLDIAFDYDYLEKIKAVYGSSSKVCLDIPESWQKLVSVRDDYFYISSKKMVKFFLSQTDLSPELVPLVSIVGLDDINGAFENCGYDIKIK